ncbi:hypothetical protein DFH28DRAFT_891962, partial [Melampsora americana]
EKSYWVLACMARDYLASTRLSCTVKQICSCASDVCLCSQTSLVAWTIKRLVSSRLWLREGEAWKCF